MFDLIDSHCHLHDSAFDADRTDVVERMRRAQIGAVTVGTDRNSSEQAITLAEASDRIFAAVAYHPDCLAGPSPEGNPDWEAFDGEAIARLAESSGRVVAIGETGLDYSRLDGGSAAEEERKKRQRDVLAWHLDLAASLNLPTIFHIRDAFDDAIEILSKRRVDGEQQNVVIHCFTGDWAVARRLLDLGCFLSFAGIITFKPKKTDDPERHVHRVVERMPLDRMLIETDAPWLAPEPHRGTRNEPGYAAETAKKVADLRQDSADDIRRATAQNAVGFFGLHRHGSA